MEFTRIGEENPRLSDVIDMEEEFQGNSFVPMRGQNLQNESQRPYIEILEQPASGIRFRYEIEGRSAGSIPGEKSRPDLKTYPTIRVVGYTGKVTIVVSCVTVEDNPLNRPKAHPHKLVGRADTCKNGVCRVDLKGDNMTVSFPNLGIQCVRRKDVEASLTERQEARVDPFGAGFDHRKSHANIALNVVSLCFQGFIHRKVNDKKFWEALDPVISRPIIEKKATCTLSIHKLSHYSASVAGGMEMILLCDKVPRDDIQIRFFEERDGSDWEGYGDFQPAHVHHQYAISFRTPKYDNMDITEPVNVKIQLKLKKKDQGGPPLDFQLLPLANMEGNFKAKRKSPREFMDQYNDKRFKPLDPSLQSYIKVEPELQGPPTKREALSPNLGCAFAPASTPGHSSIPPIRESYSPIPGTSAPPSTQPPLNLYQYNNIEISPSHSPRVPTSYNIPLGGNPNIQNFEFPQTSPAVIPLNPTPNIQNFEFSQMPLTDISLNPNQNPQNVYEFPQMPPANIGPSLYNEFQPQIPREQVTNIPVENAPEAQYTTLNQLNVPMSYGTSELLDDILQNFHTEFSTGIQISERDVQPEQLNENPDESESLTSFVNAALNT